MVGYGSYSDLNVHVKETAFACWMAMERRYYYYYYYYYYYPSRTLDCSMVFHVRQSYCSTYCQTVFTAW